MSTVSLVNGALCSALLARVLHTCTLHTGIARLPLAATVNVTENRTLHWQLFVLVASSNRHYEYCSISNKIHCEVFERLHHLFVTRSGGNIAEEETSV